MTQQQLDSRKSDFLELWEMGMKFYHQNDTHWQLRYCAKSDRVVSFPELKELSCWVCPEYICNDGVCDCI
jgi:hypothetical protein